MRKEMKHVDKPQSCELFVDDSFFMSELRTVVEDGAALATEDESPTSKQQ
ncbi:hypothetical protein [Bacillus sp. HMF5848]|nr:hypothetical protein [Bacillus sp. HMF5848]